MKIPLKIVIVNFIFILSVSYISAQSNSSPDQDGNITIHKDIRIDTLIMRTVNLNVLEPEIKGYRIQIFFGSNRSKANKLKSEFMQDYPGEKIYLVYKQPYFKLLVGNYRNRIEAQKMYHTLLEDENYKGVLIIPDDIKLPDLKYSKP